MTRGSDLGPLDELARQSFAFFVRRVFETLNPGQTYMHNWHIDAICHECERVWRGLTTRLMIEMPPRSLKSIIISVAFPAFILGHDPSKHFICASYAQTLSTKNHDDFRRVLESDWYQRTFPHTRVGDWKDTGQEVILTGSGSRFATSVGGALTGRGADFLILDDLLKAQDANSETVRTGANLWVSNTAMSRLNNPGTGVVIVVAQRLHVDDVVGYLCDRSPGRWKVLSLPAIALEDVEIATGWAIAHMFRKDELLHPERLPRAVLDRIREELGTAAFDPQYLQRPQPPGGSMIKREWLQYYQTLPPFDEMTIHQSWDTASKDGVENDYSACVTIGVHGRQYYVLDVFRAKMTFPDLCRRAIQLARQYDARRIYIEDAGIAEGLRSQLIAAGLFAKLIPARGSKQDRLRMKLNMFEFNKVLLPLRAPWLSDFVAELLAFPNSRHDDQVDALSQALLEIEPHSQVRVRTDEVPRRHQETAARAAEVPPIPRRKPPPTFQMGSMPTPPPQPERRAGADSSGLPRPMPIEPAKPLARPTGIIRKPKPPPPPPEEIIFRTPAPPSRPAIAPDDGDGNGDKDGTDEEDKPEGEP